MRWTNTALQEKFSNHEITNHKDRSSNTVVVSTNIGLSNVNTWTLFIEVRKVRSVCWYGTSAIIWSHDGDCIILCRSYEAGSKIHSKLLVLKKVLLCLKEREIKHIAFCDPRKAWDGLLNNKNGIHWEIFPAFSDIRF